MFQFSSSIFQTSLTSRKLPGNFSNFPGKGTNTKIPGRMPTLILRDGKKYPFPSALAGTTCISAAREDRVPGYFTGLPDRTADNILALDGQVVIILMLILVPGRKPVDQSPLSPERVAELRKRFSLSQSDAQYLAMDPEFVHQYGATPCPGIQEGWLIWK